VWLQAVSFLYIVRGLFFSTTSFGDVTRIEINLERCSKEEKIYILRAFLYSDCVREGERSLTDVLAFTDLSLPLISLYSETRTIHGGEQWSERELSLFFLVNNMVHSAQKLCRLRCLHGRSKSLPRSDAFCSSKFYLFITAVWCV